MPGLAPVSVTVYASLHSLADRMSLRSATEIAQTALGIGLALDGKHTLALPNGKILTHSVFRRD